MTNLDITKLLSEAEVLKLPWYARGRKPGRSTAKTTLLRHRINGRLTPDGVRIRLRAVKLASGTFYDPNDVDAFFRAINGYDDDGITTSPPPTTRIAPVDTAEAEFRAATNRRAVI